MENNVNIKTKYIVTKKRSVFKRIFMCIFTFFLGVLGGAWGADFIISTKYNSIYDGSNNSTSNNIINIPNSKVEYTIESVENPAVAVASKLSASAVLIEIKTSIYGEIPTTVSQGTGTIYSSEGHIVTNYHVVENAIESETESVYVTIGDESIKAEIVGVDSTSDLAVIKVDKTGLTAAKFANSDDVKIGEMAIAIGNPLGSELKASVTVGYISALDRKITSDGRTYTLIQTDAAINTGNSGGPLSNAKGLVIGINTAKISGYNVEGIGFAIPSNIVTSIVDQLIENKVIERPYIGFYGYTYTEEQAQYHKVKPGIYVESVDEGTPAYIGGLKAKDYVMSIDGTIVKSMDELNAIKNTHKIGDKVVLKIERDGKEMDITITLSQMP